MNKKIFAIAIALLFVPTVVGPVLARQVDNPWQAGASTIYHFDVAATDAHGSGRLTIDLTKHTFVFNGKDFTPSAQIELQARAASGTELLVFAWGKATPSGNLHIAGPWRADTTPTEVAAGYTLINALDLFNRGWFVAQLACYYSTDGGVSWLESEHVTGITQGHAGFAELGDLGVPSGALVRIHAVVVGGKDRTGSEIFQYSPPTDQFADYLISGTTGNPDLEYNGLYYW